MDSLDVVLHEILGQEVCDAAGEKLAWFFDITKPKYYAELQEYEQTADMLDSVVSLREREK